MPLPPDLTDEELLAYLRSLDDDTRTALIADLDPEESARVWGLLTLPYY
jgi:hypothetical protein